MISEPRDARWSTKRLTLFKLSVDRVCATCFLGREAFVLQADRVGFGELSAFGESLVRALFKRWDADRDGALSFREMMQLQRALHQVRR
jgi:hypothetical protein